MDFVIGEVLSAGEGALSVRAEGLPLAKRDLWVNEALLPGYSPKLAGVLTGSCPDGNTVTTVSKDQLTRSELALRAGDRVVLLTTDHQTYYLICKAVRYG